MFEYPLSDFDAVTASLGLPGDAEVWRSAWAATQGSFELHEERFLRPEQVEAGCRYLRLPAPAQSALLAGLPEFEKNRALKRLAWHCYALMFRNAEDGATKPPQWPPLAWHCYVLGLPNAENGRAKPPRWPSLPKALGPAAHLFYAYVLIAGVPHIRALHATRGISEAIARDTLSDLELWMREYRKRNGVWGFDEMEWLEGHFEGRVYKLGRLQFEQQYHLVLDMHVFRHRTKQRIVALAGAGQRFREDGQFDGANDIHDPTHGWTAVFDRDEDTVRGNPIAVDGRALRQTATLPLSEWEPVLRQGDPTLNVHIPAVGPLTYSECTASFQEALAFFPKYFPEHVFKAFECYSWLLDYQLEAHLPAASNIVRFLRDYYLLPCPGADDEQTLDRVFDGKFDSIGNAAQDTSLQRAIAGHMKKGGHWRIALGFILREDVSRRPQYYRKVTEGTPWGVSPGRRTHDESAP